MIVIHLYGKYKRKFGPLFRLNVTTLPAAIRLLEANFPGQFAKQVERDKFHIARGETLGKGKHFNVEDEEMLKLSAGDGTHFHLIPAAVGAAGSMKQKGLGAIIFGAVLIGASFLIGGPLASTLFYGGLSMIMGGASLLLSPEVGKPSDEETKKSYAFNGPANVEEQGALEPVVYGEVITGSVVGAGSIKSVNQG